MATKLVYTPEARRMHEFEMPDGSLVEAPQRSCKSCCESVYWFKLDGRYILFNEDGTPHVRHS